MPTDHFSADPRNHVDVELPLGCAATVDIHLGRAAAPLPDAGFRPTLSQVAGQLPRSRARRPGRTRSGYRGASGRNGMRDGDSGESDIGRR